MPRFSTADQRLRTDTINEAHMTPCKSISYVVKVRASYNVSSHSINADVRRAMLGELDMDRDMK